MVFSGECIILGAYNIYICFFSHKGEINSTFHLMFFLFPPILDSHKIPRKLYSEHTSPKNQRKQKMTMCRIWVSLEFLFFSVIKIAEIWPFFSKRRFETNPPRSPVFVAKWSSFRWVSFICRSLAFLAARTPAMAVSLKK